MSQRVESANSSSSEHPLAQSRTRELALLVMLFVAALAIRLPQLMLIPRFEDEGADVLWSLRILDGSQTPLSGANRYYGPLFSYMVAGLWWLLGVNVLWARLLAAVVGAMTVVATYVFGRVVASQRVGLVAALLTMTSPALVVVSSHFGWSNSLTPFFALAVSIALFKGFTERRIWWAAVGGLLAGLTIQTHPISGALVIGVGVWYLITIPPRMWLARREVYAATAGALLGYAPVLWVIATKWNAISKETVGQSYALVPVASAGEVMNRLINGTRLLLDIVAGASERFWRGYDGMHLLGTFLTGLMAIAIAKGMLGYADSATRSAPYVNGRRFLLTTLLVPSFALMLVLREVQSRYIAFLLPPAYVCIAIAAEGLWRRTEWWRSGPGNTFWRMLHSRQTLALSLALVLIVDVMAIRQLYQFHTRQGSTNAEFFALRDNLVSSNACGEGLFLEYPNPMPVSEPDRSWVRFNVDAIKSVLTLSACPSTVSSRSDLHGILEKRTLRTWLILTEPTAALFGETELVRVMTVAPGPTVAREFRMALYYKRPQP